MAACEFQVWDVVSLLTSVGLKWFLTRDALQLFYSWRARTDGSRLGKTRPDCLSSITATRWYLQSFRNSFQVHWGVRPQRWQFSTQRSGVTHFPPAPFPSRCTKKMWPQKEAHAAHKCHANTPNSAKCAIWPKRWNTLKCRKATSEVSPQFTDGMNLKGVCVPNISECFQWELGCGGLQGEGLWPLLGSREIQLRGNC